MHTLGVSSSKSIHFQLFMNTVSQKQYDEKVKALEMERELFVMRNNETLFKMDQKIEMLKEMKGELFGSRGGGETVDYKTLSIQHLKEHGASHYKIVADFVTDTAKKTGKRKVSDVTVNQFLNQCVKDGMVMKIKGKRGTFILTDVSVIHEQEQAKGAEDVQRVEAAPLQE